jgi:hypothetical protein
MIKSRRICNMPGRDEKCIQKVWSENLKRPFIKPKYRWEDNIRMDLREIRWEVVDRIHLAWNRDQ